MDSATATTAAIPTISHALTPIVRNHGGTSNAVISRCAAAATRRAWDSPSRSLDTETEPIAQCHILERRQARPDPTRPIPDRRHP
jgi:hypothetical protein